MVQSLLLQPNMRTYNKICKRTFPEVRNKINRFNAKDPAKRYRLAWKTLQENHGQLHVTGNCCK